MLRLGNKVIDFNKKKDSFDFGVILVTEIGKERKNKIELAEVKKNTYETNQKNDGFNDSIKMIRHRATVDNFPFVKLIFDEQRPESLSADVRELCDIIRIEEVVENKVAIPFYDLEMSSIESIVDSFKKLYYEYRFNRSDNTFLMFLLKKIVSFLFKYDEKKRNLFGYKIFYTY